MSQDTLVPIPDSNVQVLTPPVPEFAQNLEEAAIAQEAERLGKRVRDEEMNGEDMDLQPPYKKRKTVSEVMKRRKTSGRASTWKAEILQVLNTAKEKKFTANEIWRDVKERIDNGEFISDISNEKSGIKRIYNASKAAKEIGTEVVKGKCRFFLPEFHKPIEIPPEELDVYLSSGEEELRKRRRARRLKKLKRRRRKLKRRTKLELEDLEPNSALAMMPNLPQIPPQTIPVELPNVVGMKPVDAKPVITTNEQFERIASALGMTEEKRNDFLERSHKLLSEYE